MFISFCIVKTKGAVIVNVLLVGPPYRTFNRDSSNYTGYTDDKSNDGTLFLYKYEEFAEDIEVQALLAEAEQLITGK